MNGINVRKVEAYRLFLRKCDSTELLEKFQLLRKRGIYIYTYIVLRIWYNKMYWSDIHSNLKKKTPISFEIKIFSNTTTI